MNSPILISNFDTESREQFIASDKTVLGHREMTNAVEGTIIVLTDKNLGIFGLAVARNAPGSLKPCIKSHLLDPDMYTGSYAKYNKCHIYIKEVKLFKTPISHAQIKQLINAPAISGHGNIWTNNQMSYRAPFHKGVESEVIDRYKLLINTWMNT